MEYQPVAAIPKHCDAFVRAYLESAEWSGLDDESDETPWEYSRNAFELSVSPKWDDESVALAIADCDAFRAEVAWASLGFDDSQGGHDFWLTRNHHGAGFWDGDYPEPASRLLTQAAHRYGSAYVSFNATTERLTLSD